MNRFPWSALPPRLRALCGLLAPCAVLAGCESAALPPRPAQDVYEFRLATEPPLVLRWPSGSTVRVFVAGGSTPGAAELHAAFEFGAAEWNRHALFGEYRLAETTSLADADVVLRWMEEVSPVDVSGCPPSGARAVTTFCGVNEDVRAGLLVFPIAAGGGGRVKMVVSIASGQATLPGRVQALVTHELGHVLGIVRHSPEPRDLMYGGELATTRLSRRDAAVVQVLYQLRPQVVP